MSIHLHHLVLLATVTVLALSAACAKTNSFAALPDNVSAWNVVSGDYTVAHVDAENVSYLTAKTDPVVLLCKEPLTGAFVLRARLRMPRNEAVPPVAHFTVCKKDADDPGFELHATQGGTDIIYWDVVDRKAKLLTPDVYFASPDGGLVVDELKAYQQFLPGWPREFRTLIEKDMLTQPGVNERWFSIRIEVKPGQIRFWVDDRLLAEQADPSIIPAGLVRFYCLPGAQLASLTVTPLAAKETSDYLPVHLDGYLNEKNLLPKAAVKSGIASGKVTNVGGIPFVFPDKSKEGFDHIDLGRSLYRQGNAFGYEIAYTYPFKGAFLRDPARIQLAIPNGLYDSLYVIAAADGEQDSIPEMTAMFFRSGAGFAENFAGTVPLAAATAKATRLPVTLSNGKKASLWLVKIPLDPGKLSSFADLKVVHLELTKKVYQYRSYPDPIRYGWHQGGLPSGVHIYAMTLGKTPAGFTITPTKFGHVWTEPEVPGYTLAVTNRSSKAQKGMLTITTRSYDGSESLKQSLPVKLTANTSRDYSIKLPVKLNGYHDVVAKLDFAGKQWTEKRSLVKLAPDNRAPRWTGKGPLFGYWSYHGGHYTPPVKEDVRLMTAAGARISALGNYDLIKDLPEAKQWSSLSSNPYDVYFSYVDDLTYVTNNWARVDPGNDPVKIAEFNKQRADFKVRVLAKFKELTFSEKPDEFQPDFVTFYPEPHISMILTTGNFGSYFGEEEPPYTEEEKDSIRQYVVMTTAAAEVVRENWPKVKILVPWGDPLFVVPLLRAGLSKDLIDGSGLDNPNFERLPEQQLHSISLHRLLELKSEYAKAGIPNPELYYIEGPFVPTEVGSCTWREQMDIYSRFTLISMAYGVKRFYSGWYAFDGGMYYGSEHYGGCGIQRRIPYCDPKPAYAAYAAMTDKLDQAEFERWLPTGSLTTYCLKFNSPRGNVYSLWTIRGKRPVTLTLSADAVVEVTDSMNNMKKYPTKNGQVTITTDSSVIYVTGAGDITSVKVGEPDNSDAAPAVKAKLIGNFGDRTWNFITTQDKVYEGGSYAIKRYFGDFSGEVVKDKKQGDVFRSTLEKQAKPHDLMPFYNIIAPEKPVTLPGAPSHIGVWVKGNSDWGRVIYSLRDAKGERWISTGTKDDWNCDDMHGWSSFNFDGWRYLRFELPGHTGYDSFRKHGTTWWRSLNGDGIVDLPLSLEKVIVEQRTHVIYVNDAQPAAGNSVDLGKIYLEYANPVDMTEAAVIESQIRQTMPTDIPLMPNPIAEMQKTGVGEPTSIIAVQRPQMFYDGTRAEVLFVQVPGAAKYFIWVSAHEDGQGAMNMSPADGTPSGTLIYGLRPGIPLYYWVVYEDADGKLSKPSPVFTMTLTDEFGNK